MAEGPRGLQHETQGLRPEPTSQGGFLLNRRSQRLGNLMHHSQSLQLTEKITKVFTMYRKIK